MHYFFESCCLLFSLVALIFHISFRIGSVTFFALTAIIIVWILLALSGTDVIFLVNSFFSLSNSGHRHLVPLDTLEDRYHLTDPHLSPATTAKVAGNGDNSSGKSDDDNGNDDDSSSGNVGMQQ